MREMPRIDGAPPSSCALLGADFNVATNNS